MTPEQIGLLEKASASVEAAQLLVSDGFYDFAVSRSYYSMFYVAQAMLLGEELVFSKHSAVIASFGKVFAKTKRVPPELHRHLIEAQDSRNVSDYDIISGMTEEAAITQLERAKKFLDIGTQFLSSTIIPTPDSE